MLVDGRVCGVRIMGSMSGRIAARQTLDGGAGGAES